MSKLYHATWKENLLKIYVEGIKPGFDGLTYMCTTANSTLPFLALRAAAEGRDVVVIEIDSTMLNSELIEEGFDHNPNFFKDAEVKTYPELIPPEALGVYYEAQRKSKS